MCAESIRERARCHHAVCASAAQPDERRRTRSPRYSHPCTASAVSHIHRLVNVPARWHFVKPGCSSDRVGHGERQRCLNGPAKAWFWPSRMAAVSRAGRRRRTFPELAGGAGTGFAAIDSLRVAGWKPRAAGRAWCFRHHTRLHLSLRAALRTPLWRCGWVGWPRARTDRATDRRDRCAGRRLRRVICYRHACGKWLASRARAALD